MQIEKYPDMLSDIVNIAGREGLEMYIKEYERYPSAKELEGERYTNFMEYKIRKSYEAVREKFPELKGIE